MTKLFVIIDRDAHGVGLARTHQTREEAERNCASLARAYPTHSYTIEPQRYVGRGRHARVAYPDK